MPTLQNEKAVFSDIVKREHDKLFTREIVTITGTAGDVIPVGSVICTNGTVFTDFDPVTDVYGITVDEYTIPEGDTTVIGAVIARGPTVIANGQLPFPDGTTTAQETTAYEALVDLGIVARTAV